MRILSLILMICITMPQAYGGDKIPVTSSVLASGQWFRLAVISDGVYRIDYSQLKQLGLADPSNPQIFGNNKGQLSFYNDGTATDDLDEVAVMLFKGTDGLFNDGDYLLFYAKGTLRWKYDPVLKMYEASRHNYSDTAYYFLTSGHQPKSVPTGVQNLVSPNYISEQSDALFIHEKETVNILKSGREWFHPVSAQSPLKINTSSDDFVLSEGLKVRIRVAARSSASSTFSIYENTTHLENVITQPVNLFNFTGTQASITDSALHLFPLTSSLEIRFENKNDAGAKGYIDFVTIHGRVANSFSGAQKHFFDYKSYQPGMITEFRLSTNVSNTLIWEVTDDCNPVSVPYNKINDRLSFKAGTDILRTFIAFSPDNVMKPLILREPLTNQDLHASPAVDMIIISHPLFLDHAGMLAELHLRESGLKSLIVTPNQIYNEFSGGIRDIAAIRNFIRFKFLNQQGTQTPLKYLLLFGDGSYDNRTLPPQNPAYIPTYQSRNSNVVVSSFTSDDFYGLLEDGEGEAEGTEDIGIGRLPVSDTAQAGSVVRKIRNYMSAANSGDWKNVIALVADDEDGNAHMVDSENLEKILTQKAPEYNVQKFYLDSYKQVTSTTGQTYPSACSAINERIVNGCLILNYVGHGSENGLAQERIITHDNIKTWKNNTRLPLFITATCEFSRFDDSEFNTITGVRTDLPSAGELAIRNNDGGCIALMSTTRLVYSGPNSFLNRNIFDCIFDRDSSGIPVRLGDIIKKAKNNSGTSINKRCFSLLGDPALRLAYPWHGRVVTDSINGIPVNNGVDSLKSLSVITVSGHIDDPQGSLMKFNGIVSPTVFDKEVPTKTFANDGGSVMEFKTRSNILFTGKTIAKDGRFRFSFIVPADIIYDYGQGKISYYAYDDQKNMNGSTTNIVVGGFSGENSEDDKGPHIKLFMNDTLFKNGGLTDSNPVLLAMIEDQGGINTTGAGIGHDITIYIDNARNNQVNLNNYFIYDFDTYQQGTLSYQLSELGKGNHSITLKAWDNFNNSSEEKLLFIVDDTKRLLLKNLLNYPNPFAEKTKITGELNRPDGKIEVTLQIFDLSGKTISTIRKNISLTGYTMPEIEWDRKANGTKIAKGIYPYVVTVRTTSGEITRSSGRMIVL